MERLQQIARQTTASLSAPTVAHPLDPLSPQEIRLVADVLHAKYQDKDLGVNVITLREPTKNAYYTWKERKGPLPPRLAYFVVTQNHTAGLTEGVVDVTTLQIIELQRLENMQPILSPNCLSKLEKVMRKDPTVIEQCVLSGVPADEMHNVYCDAWAIGYDERWGSSRRLQQAIMYYRSEDDDSQYSHPLDFCPIYDMKEQKIIYIDIPNRRRKISKHKHSSFHPKHVAERFGTPENPLGYRQDDHPIEITQPKGVSFKMDGNVISWSNFNFHIGFNYREGIVLSDINYNDHGNERPLFHRISLAEMIVPYGNPEFPHQRKHALDIGEYGAGYCTNSLALGCDCKGAIHYLDAHMITQGGAPTTVKNAVCIHEEDDGLLFKHSDFRDDFQTNVTTRGKRLIVSQIFTVGNYEYCTYWTFRQDGTIKLEIRLSGILNTFICDQDEDVGVYGTKVYPMVNAHNHQHLFSLRMHPRIDGDGNSAATSDAVSSEAPVGSAENTYGNGFYCKKTVFNKVKDSLTNFELSTARTWDIFNPKLIHPYSGKPALYKLVSTFCSPSLCKPGSLVAKRAPWIATHTQVVPYQDEQHGYGRIYPSGEHVCQWSGDGPRGIRKWIGDGEENIEDSDIVFFHTFGISHFAAPEDFPVMPTEIFDVMLRPRHFFKENPVLDVKPLFARTTTEVKAGKKSSSANVLNVDNTSKYAFGNSCCGK